MRGLYIHIPFCNSICSYCDFPKMVANEKNKELYINKLIEEIKTKRELLHNITSVYIGGGTPNSINNELLEKLLLSIDNILSNSLENTIECNPELLTQSQIDLFNKYNINRVSLGVETINDNLIKQINRHHTKNMVKEKIYLLKDNNINNINIDLIFGFPNETIDDVNNDLDFILSLPITHLSYYSLILEEKTLLYYQINNKIINELDEDLIADMYELIRKRLKNTNFIQYEISNFSLPNYESIHNLLYWNEEEYIGVGMGASSFINNQRITNYKSLKKYLEYEVEEIIDISLEERKKEIFMLGLRKREGVNIKKYQLEYYENPIIKFKLNKWINNNFLIIDGDYLKINDDKILLSNIIFEEFV